MQGRGRRRGRVNTFILNKQDEHFKEWTALFDGAKSIASDSSTIFAALKLMKWLRGETHPLAFLINLWMYGEGRWEEAILSIIINIVACLAIGFVLCYEKRELCTSRQGESYVSLIKDSIMKAGVLMFDWISEWSRDNKRIRKIRTIEENVFRDSKSAPWKIKRPAFLSLTKFYSSHIRYINEDILLTSVRSFILSMIAIYRILDSKENALYLSSLGDYFRLAYVICVAVTYCHLIRIHEEADRKYKAIVQLWGAVWAKQTSAFPIEILCYHHIHKFETEHFLRWPMFILEYVNNFILIGTKFLGIMTGLLVKCYIGIFIWYCYIIVKNYILLGDVYICDPKKIGRSVFKNSPTGYSKRKHRHLNRFFAPLFYNFGYTSKAWRLQLAIDSCVLLSIILINLAAYDVPYETHHNNVTTESPKITLTNTRSTGPPSKRKHVGNELLNKTYNVSDCIEQSFTGNPLKLMDCSEGVITVIVFLVSALFLVPTEIGLRKLFQISLKKFEIFPFLDAADCYRALVNEIVNNSLTTGNSKINRDRENNNTINKHTGKEIELITPEIGIAVSFDTISLKFVALTILDDVRFDKVYSRFKSSSKNLSEYIQVYLYQIINLTNLSFRKIPKGLSDDQWDDLVGIEQNLNELIRAADEQIIILRACDHPLESSYFNENSRWNLSESSSISSVYGIVREEILELSENEKRNTMKLFVIFCMLLNQRLSEMCSWRIERTFEMLKREPSKIYDINDDQYE